MEGIDSVVVENLHTLDEGIGHLPDSNMLSSSSFKGSDVIGDEPAFYEKFILDDMDNYWDEINDRLTVSRMVSDSVIKGMVGAVVQEANEKISSKEEEITILSERLQNYELDAAMDNRIESLVMMPESSKIKLEMERAKFPLNCSCLKTDVAWNNTEILSGLKIAAEEQFQRLKEEIQRFRTSNYSGRIIVSSVDVGLCSVFPQEKASDKFGIDGTIDALRGTLSAVFEQMAGMFYLMGAWICEQQWEHDFQREISAIVTQNFINSLQVEFETKMHEQRSLINTLNMNWQKKIAELSTMREDLDTISRSLLNSEGQLFSHGSLENFDEWNAVKRKDHFPRVVSGNHNLSYTHTEENGNPSMKKFEENGNSMPEVADSSQLMHMSKEELISYYKTEMTKMKRQHESALHEKTEELFRFKREFLKEKGSSHLRKDKEFDLLKKRIPEVILKLDDILLDKEKLPTLQNDHEELCNLEDRMNTMFLENQHLRGLLTDKRKEIKYLSSQVSDATSKMSFHSSIEAKFLKQIQQCKGDLEDVKIEAYVKDEVYGVTFKDIFSNKKIVMEDIEIETNIMQEIFSIVIRGFVGDVLSDINSTVQRYYHEKASIETLLLEKKHALCTKAKENEQLKQSVASLNELVKEKEKLASEAGSTLLQQQDHYNLVNQELNMLRDQLRKQGILISNYNVESESLRRRLEEASQKISQYEMEMAKLSENSATTSNALEEAEKQNAFLCGVIQENEKKLLSSFAKEKQQSRQLNSIICSLMELSEGFLDFQNKLSENIERNESRLNILSHQCNPLLHHARLLMKKEFWYKQMLELRYSNLQKAEAEVDLLGDEVDALVSLLGKIYIALDHYSPVLQHYPGVMEILKLVRRELEGETTPLM